MNLNQCLDIAFNDETGVVTLEFSRGGSVVTLRLSYEDAGEMWRQMNEMMLRAAEIRAAKKRTL